MADPASDDPPMTPTTFRVVAHPDLGMQTFELVQHPDRGCDRVPERRR